jgi:hypothetical protein
MAFPEQEVPLILIVFLGSLGSAFILLYRNFLCPKEETVLVQKVFVFASLVSSFLSVTSVLNPNKTIFLFHWILSCILLIYSVTAIFLPSAYSRSMVTWSDVLLVGLGVSFFFMRVYASLLLTYDRARQKGAPPSFIRRPISTPDDLYTLNYPNSMKIDLNIPRKI